MELSTIATNLPVALAVTEPLLNAVEATLRLDGDASTGDVKAPPALITLLPSANVLVASVYVVGSALAKPELISFAVEHIEAKVEDTRVEDRDANVGLLIGEVAATARRQVSRELADEAVSHQDATGASALNIATLPPTFASDGPAVVQIQPGEPPAPTLFLRT